MDDSIKQVLEFRQSILDNVDDIVKYSREFHKDKAKSSTQLSLFAEETIEISKPDLNIRHLERNELNDAVSKEADVLGIPIIYDPYKEYIIIERSLCNTTLNDFDNVTKDVNNAIFITKVVNVKYMTSSNGNKYAKVLFNKNGLEVEMYLFGEYYEKNIRNIFKNGIYIVRANYNSNRQNYFINKIQSVTELDPTKYVKSINIELTKPESIIPVKKILDSNIKNDGIIAKIVYGGSTFDYNNNIWLNSDEINKLIDNGCNVQLKRSI